MITIVIEIIGVGLLVYSITIFLKKGSIDPIVVLNFEDGAYEFDLKHPGYYSVSVLGAGFIHNVEIPTIKLTFDNGDELYLDVNKIPPRFKRNNSIGMECWGFSTINTGHGVITLSNLGSIEARSSMSRLKRVIEPAIDHGKLRIIIHRSVQPFFLLTSIIGLVLGVGLIVLGILVELKKI